MAVFSILLNFSKFMIGAEKILSIDYWDFCRGNQDLKKGFWKKLQDISRNQIRMQYVPTE